MKPSESLPALEQTAFFTAAVRARESERDDALFCDPWAARLAGEAGFAILNSLPVASALWPTVRTRFLDECLRRWTDEDACAQVVLPAAGLDTRAYRLDWPMGTRLYEIDQLELLDHKERVLEAAGARPRCVRVALGADLREDWAPALLGAGFEPELPSIWIVEGLLMYLDTSGAGQVLDKITQLAAPGSRMGLDLPGRTLRGFEVGDPGRWLADTGWQADVAGLQDVAVRFGRWPYPVRASGLAPKPAVYLVAACRA